jgi:Leucine Rich repeat
LQQLVLESNGIGPEGAISIATRVPFLAQLHELMLPGNLIEDKGATAIVEGVASLSQFWRLNLVNNCISEEARTFCRDTFLLQCRNVLAKPPKLEL